MFRLLVLIGAAFVAVAAWGETIVVSPGGPLTIQAAIAQAAPGDVVELLDGVFTGPGNRDIRFLGKAITVRSQSGDPGACVIDCEGSPSALHRGFLFDGHETPDARLEGLTITGGYQSWGGGVCCQVGAPTIRHCRFVGNTATSLGGGLVTQSPTTVSDCLFADNASASGGGACAANTIDDLVVFERCTFVGNTAGYYGGGFRS